VAGDQADTGLRIHWRASKLTYALATCAGLTLAAALLGSKWQLVAFAAPMLGVLVSVRWQSPAMTVTAHGEPDLVRCFETETAELEVRVEVQPATSADAIALSATAPDDMRLAVSDRRSGWCRIGVSAERWGRYPIMARVEVVARGGLLAGTATTAVAEVFVFPVAPPQATDIPRTELLDRLGTHLTRHIGRGVEYADIRPYVPGDQLRTVNWSVSARRGNLHVTERLSERAADVVVLLDTYAQPPGPATASMERTVRGAVQVVQSSLRNGDRAGVIALGGRPRWLGADIGRRQFYRVLDAVLAAGDNFETTKGTLAPRAAVPPGAIIVGFSTLLDTDFALAMIDLCRHGHVVVAVDVLDGLPLPGEHDPLIARMWSLQRSFMYRDMRTIGVDVVPWRADTSLEQAMYTVPERRRRVRGRR
jgi:uncharacterized protein (DUF58 family)